MKNTKRIVSLCCILMMLLSLTFSVCAFEAGDDLNFKLKASKTTISAGDTFTITLYSDVDPVVTYDTALILGCIEYNSTEFVVSSDGIDNYISVNAPSTTKLKDSAIAFTSTDSRSISSKDSFTFTVTAVDTLANGTYTFDLVDFYLTNTDWGESTYSNDTLTITVDSVEPDYPKYSGNEAMTGEEVFASDSIFTDTPITSVSKSFTVFGKASQDLAVKEYGIKVTNSDNKVYTFAGKEVLTSGDIWAIKIVSPDGSFSFADGGTLSPISIVTFEKGVTKDTVTIN